MLGTIGFKKVILSIAVLFGFPFANCLYEGAAVLISCCFLDFFIILHDSFQLKYFNSYFFYFEYF